MTLLSPASLPLWLLLVSTAPPLDAQFTKTTKLAASDGAMDDEFGGSVSISGDIALVGAALDNTPGTDSGSAYVFERDAGGNWTAVAKLLASDGTPTDKFGGSVSISGDRALVGAERDDAAAFDSGSAYVFERDPGGTWTQVTKLVASDGSQSDCFGYSVSISGDRAVVGAIAFGATFGSAYVFERDAGGTWTQVQKLVASDSFSEDHFGTSVSIFGDVVLVGCDSDDDLGMASGSAYVFERDASGTWVEVTKLLASEGLPGDRFGKSVSLFGERALVGAPGDTYLGTDSNSAYVFKRDAGGTWTAEAKLEASDATGGENFGSSVSIFGSRAVVGAHEDDDMGLESGSAYVFELGERATWAQAGKLLAGDGFAGDLFGTVSISGDVVLVGATGDSFGAGSAYVFEPCNVSLPSAEVVRLGSPPNPNALLPGVTSGPVLGFTWNPIIDHRSFMPGAFVDYLGITANPLNLHLPPLGTLLCDPAFTIATEIVAAGNPFAIPIPRDCAFAGVTVCSQGVSLDLSAALHFTNALDITIGAL